MPEDIDIIERIHIAYRDLPAAERKVADYVLTAMAQVQFMSITQLAEECGVADATVSRFCRSLELKGFNAFKIELAKGAAAAKRSSEDSISADSPESRRSEVSALAQNAVRQTMELLSPASVERALELFEGAGHVVCFGSGGSMIMASACAQLFSTVSNKFLAISDSHNQLSAVATMEPGDVIVLFSYSGATTVGIQILELAKRLGIRSVLVTRFTKSPAANLADVVLCCGSNEGPFQLGSVPAKIAQLVIMDVLYQEYCYRNQDSCRQNIRNIASALSESHM